MPDDNDDWLSGGDTTEDTSNTFASSDSAEVATSANGAVIPSGPPVPNPYVNVLVPPCKSREYLHWARSKHLQYKYLTEYSKEYYHDCIDYMDKRLRGIKRDVPRPQEWSERALRLYAKDDIRLSANDRKYWITDANKEVRKCSIFNPCHSKDYYRRQYPALLV